MSSENKDNVSVEATETIKDETSNAPQAEESALEEDFKDIDLNSIQIATDVLDQMNAELNASNGGNAAYSDIMSACSSTAQTLKQTISDVLKSRENILIAAGDCTSEFEADLSKKLADFENVVSDVLTPDSENDLTNLKEPAFSSVVITEVNEPEETIVSSLETSKSEEKEPSSSDTVIKESNPDIDLKLETKVADKSLNDDRKLPNSNAKNSKAKNVKVPSVQQEIVNQENSEEDKSNKKQKTYGNKKKGEKTVDQVLKSLANHSSTEEKLQVLCKKHIEVLEELRSTDSRLKQMEKQVTSQQREKEQLQAEHNRMILAKSRLESLCRELQRQNRAVKEESLLHIKEEEEKRKEIANKFQVTLNDISALMQEHSKKNLQLREENAELARKLKALVDHYDMWEKHMQKVMHQNDLEAQLAKAKYAKVNLVLKQETEKFLREKQSLLENMSELQKKCTLLTSNELKLRTELGDYTSKYEEFQSVLNKSSQVFASFKTDMDATSKKIKKLEKETNVYKQKWENSNNALLGMINDKQKYDKEISNANQRISTLEKLCRALQAERNELQNQINLLTGSASTPSTNVPSQTEAQKA